MKTLGLITLSLVLVVGSACAADIQRTVFSADVVASPCHVVVDVEGARDGNLVFEPFHKSTKATVLPRDFTVSLYESGTAAPGCSAFQFGQLATIEFGNPGQLDAGGVVTRGAGDGVRIDVRAVDAQADYRATVTEGAHKVNYPVEFAAKGAFRFRAQPVIPKDVKAGEYSGALAFVISYQ